MSKHSGKRLVSSQFTARRQLEARKPSKAAILAAKKTLFDRLKVCRRFS
jgi:hypothetical protein